MDMKIIILCLLLFISSVPSTAQVYEYCFPESDSNTTDEMRLCLFANGDYNLNYEFGAFDFGGISFFSKGHYQNMRHKVVLTDSLVGYEMVFAKTKNKQLRAVKCYPFLKDKIFELSKRRLISYMLDLPYVVCKDTFRSPNVGATTQLDGLYTAEWRPKVLEDTNSLKGSSYFSFKDDKYSYQWGRGVVFKGHWSIANGFVSLFDDELQCILKLKMTKRGFTLMNFVDVDNPCLEFHKAKY